MIRSDSNAVSRAPGFTLIELLVVIGIIGVLVALLLPAVQKVRSAADNTQCKNNIRQILLGLHNYHSTNWKFPPGIQAPGNYWRNGHTTWLVFILPYIEQGNLAAQYDWKAGQSMTNEAVFNTVIKTYQCPSDSQGFYMGTIDPGMARSNYVGCFSPDRGFVENGAPVDFTGYGGNLGPNPTTKISLFNFNVYRRLADIWDGASNTVVVSELIAGPDNTADARGVWGFDYGCMYTHHLPPNSPLPDEMWSGNCSAQVGNCVSTKTPIVGTLTGWKFADFAARSYHPGGVNAGLADASVRFVTNGIDVQVWHDLASIRGGEVIPGDY